MYLRRQMHRQTRSDSHHHLSQSARQVLERFNTEPPRKISSLFDEGRYVQVARQDGTKEIVLFYSDAAERHLLAVIVDDTRFVVTIMPLDWWRGERIAPGSSAFARAKALASAERRSPEFVTPVSSLPQPSNDDFELPWAERKRPSAICALLTPVNHDISEALAA